MAKWYLFWVLTVQGYDANIKQVSIDLPMTTKAECVLEAEAKIKEMEFLLGKDYYTTHYFGAKVRVGGRIINVEVGCEQRDG